MEIPAVTTQEFNEALNQLSNLNYEGGVSGYLQLTQDLLTLINYLSRISDYINACEQLSDEEIDIMLACIPDGKDIAHDSYLVMCFSQLCNELNRLGLA